MQSNQGPDLRQGFDEADTETVEAQRRQQSRKAETAVHVGPVADIRLSNQPGGGRASVSGELAFGEELAFGDLAFGDTGGAGTGADLAHDFSNLAMSVVSAANLLHRCGEDPARVAQIARLLRETGERAVAISRRPRPRPRRRVLLVEEDATARADLGDALAAAGLKALPAANVEEAVRRCAAGERFDLLVTGFVTSRGLTLIRRLRQLQDALPAIVVSGFDLESAQSALAKAALDGVTLVARSAHGEDLAARAAALMQA
jgi:CheY-like chemotaxis protein